MAHVISAQRELFESDEVEVLHDAVAFVESTFAANVEDVYVGEGIYKYGFALHAESLSTEQQDRLFDYFESHNGTTLGEV